ncbi:MAG: uroporphyrinogen decarboxylase family protein [Chloroflexi bacterium]|nr:uroporphyrinogen decarboxylase family protein [Chloroflexota bacterium]
MAEMTSLERCMTVLKGGIPDRVPVCLENFMHAATIGGYTIRDYCLDGEKMADAHIKAWQKFGHDMIDVENGVAALAQAVGCGVDFTEDAAPWVIAPAIESLEEVDKLKPIDPYQDGTLPEVIKATRLISKELGHHVCLLSEADQGPFSLASHIVSPAELLPALLDPDKESLIHRLLEYSTEQVLRYARALTDAGAHLTMMGESIAGPDVCSPDVYSRFAFPYEKRIIETLRTDGKEIGMHICGNATKIIEPMVGTGSIFLQVDYKIDRDACKRTAQGKTTLIGTVDPSGVMALGTPENVSEMARYDIEHLGSGGGFILSPGCVLPHTTPDENVFALLETARTFGQYA